MEEAYASLQGDKSVVERIQDDVNTRLHQQPKVGQTPTLSTAAFQNADGSTSASVTTTWDPNRKDMDYILRWKKSTESNYTYERARKSPHVIRPVETGVTINVGLSLERRQTGARGQFGPDASISTPGDTTAPDAPTGLTCTSNPVIGTISLQWSASVPGDFAYFVISRGTSVDPTGEYARALGTTFEDINATLGTTYHYRVRAADRTGNLSGYSNDTACTVIALMTLTVAPNKTSVLTVPAAFATALSQRVIIPAGAQRLKLNVNVISNVLVGTQQVSVRFSVGTSGVDTSNTAVLTFTAGGQQQGAQLTSTNPLSVSGDTFILYEWMTAGSISAQLTSAGSIEVVA